MKKKVIELVNVSKWYYLEKPRTLKNWFKTLVKPFERYQVLNNFSLSVNKGDFILITGPNGSGKSTLLKLIAGIIGHDTGTIKTNGRIVPLIELGAGFNFELSGYENAIINATILGIPKKTIHKILPQIITFSELEHFINTPLKRYSSGMVSRLAFSIALYANPDILLLDEIFAVGDESFRNKTMDELRKLNKEGKTILLTTHFAHDFFIKPTRTIVLS